MTRVLVTPRSITQHDLNTVAALAPLRERGFELISGPPGRLPGEDELAALVRGVDGWIAGVEPITAKVFGNADRLRVISRNGVGADAIDQRAAAAHEVAILLARGSNARGVAELALGLMLAAVRNIPNASAAMHDGRWERVLGSEIADHRVGIVGYGAIGRIVGRLVTALGAELLAHDAFTEVPAAIATADLATLFAGSSIVSLHTPPAPDGAPLVTGALLKTMRPGSILINTARGVGIRSAAGLRRRRLPRRTTRADTAAAASAHHPDPASRWLHRRQRPPRHQRGGRRSAQRAALSGGRERH